MESLKDFLRPEVIWVLIGLALLAMELILPGLIIFFFGVGACVVALVCVFVDISLDWQLGIFIISSLVSLLFLRRFLKGIFMGYVTSKQNTGQDLEEYVGQRVVVVKKIVPNLGGTVEFHGANWEAMSDVEIAEGSVVEIIGKDNLTLKVKAIQ